VELTKNQKRAQYMKQYYHSTPARKQKALSLVKKYSEAHREEKLAYLADYREANADIIRAQQLTGPRDI
jgi:hypothetical protein